ncbi:MAG: hypothetical protein J6V30_05905 [Paludibacteraceae bacterium]|nr:hypothetical protein [Paludibacteraceae bacterium]
MKKIPILVVRFKNELNFKEIPLFRGAVIDKTSKSNNLLFHNHQGNDVLRYRYPFIQYKRLNKRATLVCIGDGVEVIGQFFASGNFDLRIGEQMLKFEVDTISPSQQIIQIWDTTFFYSIRKWLPLNKENFLHYQNLQSLSEKCCFLEAILNANILSMSKSLGIFFDKQIKCSIQLIEKEQICVYKNVKMIALDLFFITNVSLPNYIGLGKGVSVGFGIIKQMKK